MHDDDDDDDDDDYGGHAGPGFRNRTKPRGFAQTARNRALSRKSKQTKSASTGGPTAAGHDELIPTGGGHDQFTSTYPFNFDLAAGRPAGGPTGPRFMLPGGGQSLTVIFLYQCNTIMEPRPPRLRYS